MKTYKIEQKYDEDLFTDVIVLKENEKILFTVKAKEGNILELLKSKIQKEYVVSSGYLGNEIAVLKSNFSISSSWEFVLNRKTIAKAEIKGIQYFTIKLTDEKQTYTGKSTGLTEIDLKKERDFGNCIHVKRVAGDKLDMTVSIECKVNPEAILALAIAFDNKHLLEV